MGISGIFRYFADLNGNYFILKVNLAVAMEVEDVSYMSFF